MAVIVLKEGRAVLNHIINTKSVHMAVKMVLEVRKCIYIC